MEIKKYGVWGLGVVGKSVLKYLHTQNHLLSVMDQREPTEEEKKFLAAYDITFMRQSEQEFFFNSNDYIVASPGIARGPSFNTFKIKEELDLFCEAWSKPLITVTGSLGKTSTVELLSQLLKKMSISVATGGNIGTGMLDLLVHQERSSYALLELSSFQLENTTHCAPDLALWTNFYPNHLDRHLTLEQYFLAKYNSIRYQKTTQKAVVPITLESRLRTYTNRPLNFFSIEPFNDRNLSRIRSDDTFYGKKGTEFIKISDKKEEVIALTRDLPALSFLENWLIILAALDILSKRSGLPTTLYDVNIPEHRLEKVAVLEGITFYNDSKSSIFEATYAAVGSLQPHPINLLLGGVSKGVARTELIHLLKNKVKALYCFGTEALELHQAALKAGIESRAYSSLDEAFKSCYAHATHGDSILLSPGGASFDLYKNYKERGSAFKELVNGILSNNISS
ncbi:UDP-N-acetylmuramoyl-L-alanine--D-glutamate ligase [Candidatus Dependentiae bacterium]|nr:UDP-N-acetylmuramoyl-L-alanine--D-glutamate ligase [Candidatus Dependentiae bacterium]